MMLLFKNRFNLVKILFIYSSAAKSKGISRVRHERQNFDNHCDVGAVQPAYPSTAITIICGTRSVNVHQ